MEYAYWVAPTNSYHHANKRLTANNYPAQHETSATRPISCFCRSLPGDALPSKTNETGLQGSRITPTTQLPHYSPNSSC